MTDYAIVGGQDPWCFTDATSGAWGACQPLTCSQGVRRACPAGAPPGAGAAADAYAPWAAPACVDALCGARAALANISACVNDTDAEKSALSTAFDLLNASQDFATALAASPAPAPSLSAYCDAQYGQLCVDDVIAPACPSVFRSDNYWMVRTTQSTLCDAGCLAALCGLQQRRRHFNASTGAACADADLEMLIR
jgi:hypothetical protein